jgi:hypothetical protein
MRIQLAKMSDGSYNTIDGQTGRKLCSVQCNNGGTCIDDGSSCSCPIGFGGKLCDYECQLECKNGGQCTLTSDDEKSFNDQIWSKSSDRGEFCQCRLGFAGPECQFEADVCGEAEHICLHGTKCVADLDEIQSYRCECPSVNNTDEISFKNETFGTCVQPRTEFCTPKDGHLEYVGGMAIAAFCVNGGKCADVDKGGQM